MSGRVPGPLHDQIIERLRQVILSGRFAFGERILEKELCLEFEVSRTPLREALKVLAAEGLVELFPNRGAHVRTFSEQELHETFEYLGGLEALAGRLACERITREEFENLEQLHYQMYKNYLRQELDQYFSNNLRFHNEIVAAARNRVLQASFSTTSVSMQRLRYSANLERTRNRWGTAVREHEQMIEALRIRDGAELAEIMLRHLRHKSRAVVDWIVQSGDTSREFASVSSPSQEALPILRDL